MNNLPFINLRNVDGAALVSQQNVLKSEFASMLNEQKLMRSQLSSIKELLENNGMGSSSSAAGIGDSNTTRSQSAPTASGSEVNSLQNALQAINEQIPASEPATAEQMPASEQASATLVSADISAEQEISRNVMSYSEVTSCDGRAMASATTSRGNERRETTAASR